MGSRLGISEALPGFLSDLCFLHIPPTARKQKRETERFQSESDLSLFYYNQNGHGFSLLTLGFFLLAKRGKAKEAKAIDWL